MAQYECPRCDGGFPETDTVKSEGSKQEYDACPWCGLPITGMYDTGLNTVISQ